ncbi:sterile alpha motif domain-containing protein 3-like [Pseudorasbora parva]|uniref:sterile alpha motif domain-containing protein 3-like n=1 Tax=Pseudorasbora parva TaxID=51549 RepID=UPI00351DFF3B
MDISNVRLWTVSDVCCWLTRNDLSALAPSFEEHQIDGDTLLALNDRMVEQLVPIIKQRIQFNRMMDKLNMGKNNDLVLTSGGNGSSSNIDHETNAGQTWPTIFKLPDFPALLKQKMENNMAELHQPTFRSKWRSQIVQVLFDYICTITWYPTQQQYKEVCTALTEMYPNLRDQTGIGYESWHGMLRNKFKKERKPLVDLNLINVPGQYMRKGRKRSLDENENDTASIADMTTEDEFSIRQHISKMNTECEKKKPNISMLQDKMKRTERDRDVYIKEKSTQEVLIKYPALRLPAIIFSEMKTKYNTDVDRRILTGFGTTAEKIVTEAQRRGVAKDLLAMYNTAHQSHAEEAHKA